MNLNRSMFTVALVLAVAVIAIFSGPALSSPQDNGPAQTAPPSPEQMQEMMKKWLDTIEPGPQHKWLAESAGEWNTVTRMWMMGPEAPPTETKGMSTIRVVLGGRFIQEEHKGEMLMPGPDGQIKPMPYEGMGMFGYDKYRNLFTGNWYNNMGTNTLTMAGTLPPGSSTLTLYGEMDEPMLNIIGRTVKYVTKRVDKDNAIFTIYDLAAGDDHKAVEIVYTRKK